MTEPVVYVSSWKTKEGKFDVYERFHERLANTVRDLEPRVPAFLAFANDDGTEVTGIHVFPDADALDRHMGVLASHGDETSNDRRHSSACPTVHPNDLRAGSSYTDVARLMAMFPDVDGAREHVNGTRPQGR